MPKFRSGLEQTFHNRFKTLPYETDRLSYVQTHHYVPDFVLGDDMYAETKGIFGSADRSRHILLRKQRPEVKVLFVFQVPTKKLSKRSKISYANWCDKNGFKWISIKDIHLHTPDTMRALLK